MTATGAGLSPAASKHLLRNMQVRGGSVRQIASVVMLVAGIAVLGQGAFIPAKAWVGQQMLAHAFEDGHDTGVPAEPWGWADFRAIARITVPRIGAEAIALDASTGAAMAWGPGAVPGLDDHNAGLTAYAGHRDTHLAFLGDLRPGDIVVVDNVDGASHRYQVTGAQVVDSRHWRFPASGRGLMLATCWPLKAITPGPLRLIVSAAPV